MIMRKALQPSGDLILGSRSNHVANQHSKISIRFPFPSSAELDGFRSVIATLCNSKHRANSNHSLCSGSRLSCSGRLPQVQRRIRLDRVAVELAEVRPIFNRDFTSGCLSQRPLKCQHTFSTLGLRDKGSSTCQEERMPISVAPFAMPHRTMREFELMKTFAPDLLPKASSLLTMLNRACTISAVVVIGWLLQSRRYSVV